jgi:sporulation inhibitor KapD
MASYVYGPLHSVIVENRIVTIKTAGRVTYYYMAKGLFTTFLQYLNEGIYLFMMVSDHEKRMKGVTVKTVESLEKILYPDRQNPRIFYDVNIIKSGIKNIVNGTQPKLFLDLEMSMPPYQNYEHFISEIIQCGMVLIDGEGHILENHTNFIKPVLFKELSNRTKKFLKITQETIDGGIPYLEFYRLLERIVKTYRPMIVVWGQNDIIELKKTSQVHHLPDITRNVQFIDLLKLHKHYFGLKNDLGLFNAYKLYATDDLEKQAHDAFEDAMVTKMIFDGFKKVCNGEMKVLLNEPSENRLVETVEITQ